MYKRTNNLCSTSPTWNFEWVKQLNKSVYESMHRKLVRNVGQHRPAMCQPVYCPPMCTLFTNCLQCNKTLQDDASQNVVAFCVQDLWAGRQSLHDVATGLQSMNSLEKRIEELKSWLHSVELQLVSPIVLEQCSEPGLNKCLAHHDVSSSTNKPIIYYHYCIVR